MFDSLLFLAFSVMTFLSPEVHASTRGFESERADSLYSEGIRAYHFGRHDESIRFFDEARNIVGNLPCKFSSHAANADDWQAYVLEQAGRRREAERISVFYQFEPLDFNSDPDLFDLLTEYHKALESNSIDTITELANDIDDHIVDKYGSTSHFRAEYGIDCKLESLFRNKKFEEIKDLLQYDYEICNQMDAYEFAPIENYAKALWVTKEMELGLYDEVDELYESIDFDCLPYDVVSEVNLSYLQAPLLRRDMQKVDSILVVVGEALDKSCSLRLKTEYEILRITCKLAVGEQVEECNSESKSMLEKVKSIGWEKSLGMSLYNLILNSFPQSGYFSEMIKYAIENEELSRNVYGDGSLEHIHSLGLLAQAYVGTFNFNEVNVVYERIKRYPPQKFMDSPMTLSQRIGAACSLAWVEFNYFFQLMNCDAVNQSRYAQSLYQLLMQHKKEYFQIPQSAICWDPVEYARNDYLTVIDCLLSILYSNVGKPASGLSLMTQDCKNISHRSFGCEALYYETIADVYEKMGMDNQALENYIKYYEMVKGNIGIKLLQLARLYNKVGEVPESVIVAVKNSIEDMERFYVQNYSHSDVALKESLLLNLYMNGMQILSMKPFLPESDEMNTAIADLCILDKSLEISLRSFRDSVVYSSGDALLEKKYIEYLSSPVVDFPETGASDNNTRAKIIALDAERENELNTIIEQIAGTSLPHIPATRDIRKCLKEGETAVETLSSMYDGNTYAVIIKNEWISPKIISLNVGESVSVNKMRLDAPELYEAIWKKIFEYADIKKDETIYFAPDSFLSLLPLEYLYDEDGIPVSESYRIYRLSSVSELLEPKLKPLTSAAFFGNIDYDAKIKSMQRECSVYNISTPSYSFHPEFYSFDSSEFGPLPETMGEILTCGKFFSNSIEDKSAIKYYYGANAVEESFKSLSGNSPSLIHIATHGCFFDVPSQSMKDKIGTGSQPVPNVSTKDAGINVRTAFLFSGARNVLSGITPEKTEDGVLTAYELSWMNLHGTELVVAAACQSGMGENRYGVLSGLPSALKSAGVKSMLISLNEVDSDATKILMERFYQNIFVHKLGVRKSLLDAQKHLREYKVKGECKYNDSKYWASFILLDAIE